LRSWERFGFLADTSQGSASAGGIIEQLERGNHVVLEFGQYGRNTAAYVLVSNLLTRRIHETWVRRKELADGGQEDEPRPLVIFIEEAHKFLTPDIASQTIFGTIARELRKYNVTLMIVDQRPSGIDSEVMSQLGTRLSCALNDDRDMNAVLMGARDAGQLRNVLARLDNKQQALVFGHAVPMPVVVRPRDYDEAFYAEMVSAPGRAVGAALAESDADRMQREIDELFPPE
jgi:DNA helicase HerA-like ATPase